MDKTRIYKWDNVKALLIFLVVLGHFVTQYTGSSELCRSLFIFIYSFHMPAFIFVSGLFAKSSLKNNTIKINRIITFLILYVLLKLVIFLVNSAFGKNPEFRLFNESGIPWYMLAMAVFTALTYVFKNLNPKVLFSISLLLSLYVGYDAAIGDLFCLSRLFVFYPIFLLGFFFDVEKVTNITENKTLKIMSALILISFIILIVFKSESLYTMRPIMTGRLSYYNLGAPAFGALIRLGWYLVSALLSFCVITVIPNSKNILSYVGGRTLAIYFLHRPLLYIFMNLGITLNIYLFLGLSIPLTLLLSIKPLSQPFDKMMAFNYNRIIKEQKS